MSGEKTELSAKQISRIKKKMLKDISFAFLCLMILVLSLLVVTLTQCSGDLVGPENSDEPVVRELTKSEKQIASSSIPFGLKLFKKINEAEGEKNIFISPLSVSMALGMTLNGANGKTYDDMKTIMELTGLTQTEINEAYKSLSELLVGIDPKTKFDIANSIWYRHTLTFEKEFIDINKNYFSSEVSPLDFNDPNSVSVINDWVNRSTNGKITDILNRIPANAIMYLINAIYFKGTWKYEFDKSNTEDGMFNLLNGTGTNCKLMYQENEFAYHANSEYQVIDLPYGNTAYNMTVILSNESISVNEWITQLDEAKWNEMLTSMSLQKGKLYLPKFTLEYEKLLNDDLSAMGMESAFNPGEADFTKMYKPGNIFISKVKHKTFVKVDEEGTEAAAVTSVEVSFTSVGGNGFLMYVNRPFVFVIRERFSNTILFMGKIINPNS